MTTLKLPPRQTFKSDPVVVVDIGIGSSLQLFWMKVDLLSLKTCVDGVAQSEEHLCAEERADNGQRPCHWFRLNTTLRDCCNDGLVPGGYGLHISLTSSRLIRSTTFGSEMCQRCHHPRAAISGHLCRASPSTWRAKTSPSHHTTTLSCHRDLTIALRPFCSFACLNRIIVRLCLDQPFCGGFMPTMERNAQNCLCPWGLGTLARFISRLSRSLCGGVST